MSDILITGATGLIGRHLLELLPPGYRVWALARRSNPLSRSTVHWLQHDLTSHCLPAQMPDRVDVVVHLAQSPHFREFPARASHMFEVGVGSTIRLLEWAQRSKVQTFVYASSGGIYGHGEQGFTEDDVVGSKGPLGFYFATKQSAELLVESYAACFTVIILRFFFVYGLEQRRDMLIPRLVQTVLKGDPIFLQGQEGMKLNPIHASDAAAAVARSFGMKESQKINVAGREVLSMKQIGDTIASHLGLTPRYTYEQEARPRNLIADIRRMEQLLWSPRVCFADGVRALCQEGQQS